MVTQFYCSSAPTFIVTSDFASELFNIIGKEALLDGIILNSEFKKILCTLDDPAFDSRRIKGVTLSTKLYPLKDMIKAAQDSEDRFILWKTLS